MSIQDKINTLNQIRLDIITALSGKNVSVTINDKFSTFAAKIRSIQGGGASPSRGWPDGTPDLTASGFTSSLNLNGTYTYNSNGDYYEKGAAYFLFYNNSTSRYEIRQYNTLTAGMVYTYTTTGGTTPLLSETWYNNANGAFAVASGGSGSGISWGDSPLYFSGITSPTLVGINGRTFTYDLVNNMYSADDPGNSMTFYFMTKSGNTVSVRQGSLDGNIRLMNTTGNLASGWTDSSSDIVACTVTLVSII